MKKSIAVVIIILFVLSILVPITIGFKVDKSFLIKSDNINFSTYNMPDYVLVIKSGDCWINQSQIITVVVYREPGNYSMNASIIITGCGLNISINERYAAEEGYLVSDGLYNVNISPKTAGTITITVINMTYNLSTSKDFYISGLRGVTQTSYGEDKVINIGRTEKIIFIVNFGQYANIHLTWVNEFWNDAKCLNQTIGDNTQGNGFNGIFEFIIDEDDFDNGIGYIIIVGDAGNSYIWDLIEVQAFYIPPPEIFGPEIGKIGVKIGYYFIIPNITYCNNIRLRVDWGDTGYSKCYGPYESGNNVTLNHRWQKDRDYTIKAQVEDVFGTMSEWETLEVTITRTRGLYNLDWLSYLGHFQIFEEVFS